MQKGTFKLPISLLERALSSLNQQSPFKISFLLTIKGLSDISIEILNLNEKLSDYIEGNTNLDNITEEIDNLNILLPGNIHINGILYIDSASELKKLENIKKFIENLPKNDFFEDFHLVAVKSGDLNKITYKNMKNEEFSLILLKDEEIKELLKDFFFVYSRFNVEFEKKIDEKLLSSLNFMKFNEIIIPVDFEKKIQYFELKNKSFNVNNSEIMKDKWKALLKQIKTDTKKAFYLKINVNFNNLLNFVEV